MNDSIDYKTGKIIYIVICIFLIIMLGFLVIYHIFDLQFTGNLSSCYMNDVWHLYCPACGCTRAMDYILHGKLYSSFIANPLILSLIIYFFSYFFPATYTFIIKRNGNIYYHFHKKLLVFFIIFNLGYFIIRNFSIIIFHYDFIHENSQYWIK